MNLSRTWNETPPRSPDRKEVELQIVQLLELACDCLRSPSSREHNERLAGWRDQIGRGEAAPLAELATLARHCAIYQTSEDGLDWAPDQLPVQLEQYHRGRFAVSVWARDLLEWIHLHPEYLNQGPQEECRSRSPRRGRQPPGFGS